MSGRLVAFGVALSLVTLAPPSVPLLVWNTTASAPVGLYLSLPERRPAVGDWVFVRPPDGLAGALAAGGYLPAGALLLKRIAAVAPSVVCRLGLQVVIGGKAAALALARDRLGRPLPAWRGCRCLAPSEIFLLNPEPHSLDSRYFGPLPARLIVGRATPIWTVGSLSNAR